MTTLTAGATAGTSRLPRRADLLWNTWRQHRLALIGLLAIFAMNSGVLLVTGLRMRAHTAGYWPTCWPGSNLFCYPVANLLANATDILGFLPPVVAMFVGAPVTAREFETGAYRFSGTQAAGPRRQLGVTLALFGAVVVAGSVLLGLLAMWWHDGQAPNWGPTYFWLSAVMLPAWTLLALCLGLMAGAVLRRVIPAMAVALAAVIVAAFAGTGTALVGRWPTGPGLGTLGSALRVAPVTARGLPPPVSYHSALTAAYNGTPFYLTARGGRLRGFSSTGEPIWAGQPGWIARHVYLPASNFGPDGSWLISSWFTGPSGNRLGPRAVQQLANRIPLPLVIWPGRGLPTWLAARHVTYWTSYQPVSRFWLFQGVLAAILLALAAAAGFAAVRLIGLRR